MYTNVEWLNIISKTDPIKMLQEAAAQVFRAIGFLKRLCNHPLLLLPLSLTSVDGGGAMRVMLVVAVRDVKAVCKPY